MRLFPRYLLALSLLGLAGLASAAPPALFAVAPPPALADAAVVRDAQAVRARPVLVDAPLLLGAADLPAAAQPAVTLNLFDDVTFVADPVRIEPREGGGVWIGRLRGVEHGQVVIVVHNGIVAGNITLPGARYHIRHAGNGVHEVHQIDSARFPPDGPERPVPPAPPAQPESFFPPSQPDDGSTIDVMVVYTATTRAAAGGTAAIEALINLAITETNQSYANSGIIQRLRLVRTEEVAYAETGDLYADLDCISNTADGCLDGIHALRDAHGADLVSLWVENGGAYCGLAWFMSSVSTSFAPNGFSTVARSCATGYYSFGHELGHNMGARHDTYVDPGTTPYAYAHGYAYPAAASPWRTIMAYNNACTAAGKNCARVQYWSNPSVSYGGVPMGDASADNQQTLDNTANTVANFRAAITYLLSVSRTGSGSGTVTSNPAGISCGGDCSESYTGGTAVILSAVPAGGSTFAGWSGACSGSGTCNLTMSSARNVTATFNLAAALSTRTHVASYGTDANVASSCDAAHPCRTLAAAFSMTATGGEILVIDSAGYGRVTLNGSVSIIAAPGAFAGIGVGAGGITGVEINTAGVEVVLRGLTLTGQGGSNGIHMTNGSRLSLENCVVSNFGSGIGIYVNTAAAVRIVDSLIRDNSHGIWLGSGASAIVAGTTLLGNAASGIYVYGATAGTTTSASISRSIVSGPWIGVVADAGAATATARVHVSRSSISEHQNYGVGAKSGAGSAILAISRSKVAGNAIGLYQSGAGAVLRTLGNNSVADNPTPSFGTLTPTPPM